MEHPSELQGSPIAREIKENSSRLAAVEALTFPKPLRPRIFTVSNQKGGVGKTTTTVNIAAALASKGLRVMVIDLDPQGNASTALGIPHHADTLSIYDVLINGVPISEVVQVSPEAPGLTCVPANLKLTGAEIEMVALDEREHLLKKALQTYFDTTIVRPDYIFIDCPPSLGLLTINSWTAAAEVLVPIQCEYYALEGVQQLTDYVSRVRLQLNPHLSITTVLLTMFDNRTRLAGDVADEVRKYFPDQVLDAVIPRSVRVSEAPSYGKTVISYDRRNPGAISYLEAAAEIAMRGEQSGR